jgi:hypothetical protein
MEGVDEFMFHKFRLSLVATIALLALFLIPEIAMAAAAHPTGPKGHHGPKHTPCSVKGSTAVTWLLDATSTNEDRKNVTVDVKINANVDKCHNTINGSAKGVILTNNHDGSDQLITDPLMCKVTGNFHGYIGSLKGNIAFTLGCRNYEFKFIGISDHQILGYSGSFLLHQRAWSFQNNNNKGSFILIPYPSLRTIHTRATVLSLLAKDPNSFAVHNCVVVLYGSITTPTNSIVGYAICGDKRHGLVKFVGDNTFVITFQDDSTFTFTEENITVDGTISGTYTFDNETGPFVAYLISTPKYQAAVPGKAGKFGPPANAKALFAKYYKKYHR